MSRKICISKTKAAAPNKSTNDLKNREIFLHIKEQVYSIRKIIEHKYHFKLIKHHDQYYAPKSLKKIKK